MISARVITMARSLFDRRRHTSPSLAAFKHLEDPRCLESANCAKGAMGARFRGSQCPARAIPSQSEDSVRRTRSERRDSAVFRKLLCPPLGAGVGVELAAVAAGRDEAGADDVIAET